MHDGCAQGPVGIAALDRVRDLDRHPGAGGNPQRPQEDHLVAEAEAGVRIPRVLRRQLHPLPASRAGGLLHLRVPAVHGQAQIPADEEEVLRGQELPLERPLARVAAGSILRELEESGVDGSSASRGVPPAGDDGLGRVARGGWPAVARGVAWVAAGGLGQELPHLRLRVVLAVPQVAVRIHVVAPAQGGKEDEAVAGRQRCPRIDLEGDLGGAASHLDDAQRGSVP
mmetsp:Transcript_85144/g.253831  ORF Transcript_85144/g.253831 Transcript_85144/m.253831 type:complete len:227 (+) Transcript_85144:427-1107(+)